MTSGTNEGLLVRCSSSPRVQREIRERMRERPNESTRDQVTLQEKDEEQERIRR